MTHAYSDMYLNDARRTLAGSFDAAVYTYGYALPDYYALFINSRLSVRFEKGDPFIVSGMSGTELASRIIESQTGADVDAEPVFHDDRSPEYWAGWALAYYEWYKNISFEQINNIVPISDVVSLYDPLHEADITKFVEVMDARINEKFRRDQLARLRIYAGLTQKALAENSGVSVRMIEQYEQGKKDINKASAETVYKLSQALGCSMEDLIKIQNA